MKVRSLITREEYIRLMFVWGFRSKPVIVSLALGVILILAAGTLILAPGAYAPGVSDSVSTQLYIALFIGIYLVVSIPVRTYRNAGKNYDSNKRIQEDIEYDFTAGKMTATGQTFTSEMELYHTWKIIELDNFFLLYVSRAAANIIPKKYLDATEIIELRELLRQIKTIKRSKLRS